MALPPCHFACQFIVNNDKIDCILYQRSCDVGLGLPYNIASYGLLTYIIGKITGKKPNKLIIFLGDVHIYENHVDEMKKQIEREPYVFPLL